MKSKVFSNWAVAVVALIAITRASPSAAAYIPEADGDTTAKSLTIAILGDDKDETLEAFLVNLSSPTGGATLREPAALTVSINNKKDSGCAAMGSEIAWMAVLLVLMVAMRRVSY